MTEQQLLYFTTIVQSGGFMQTALELNISQSAVSKHVRALEEELGTTLFDRSKRQAVLTEAGQALYPQACKILGEMRQMRRTARSSQVPGRKRMVVLALPIIGQMGFYRSISAFERKHPECRVELVELEEAALFQRIREGDYDLAFTYFDALRLSNDTDFTPLIEDELCAGAKQDHEITRRDSVHIRDLAEYPLLCMMKYTCVSRLYEQKFKEASFVPQIAFRGRPESILAGASAGEAVALVTRMHAAFVPLAGITLLPFEPALRITFGVVKNQSSPMRALCEELIRMCKSECA